MRRQTCLAAANAAAAVHLAASDHPPSSAASQASASAVLGPHAAGEAEEPLESVQYPCCWKHERTSQEAAFAALAPFSGGCTFSLSAPPLCDPAVGASSQPRV